MKIINDKEIDAWVFEHTVIMGNTCDSIKDTVDDEENVNIAFVDRSTGDRIDFIYG